MADTPDLSRIVNLIMENPALIEQISSMLKQEDARDTEKKEVSDAGNEVPAEDTAEVYARPHEQPKSHRRELLNAMKPYLSEGRRSAIDSMMSISSVLEMMKKR